MITRYYIKLAERIQSGQFDAGKAGYAQELENTPSASKGRLPFL